MKPAIRKCPACCQEKLFRQDNTCAPTREGLGIPLDKRLEQLLRRVAQQSAEIARLREERGLQLELARNVAAAVQIATGAVHGPGKAESAVVPVLMCSDRHIGEVIAAGETDRLRHQIVETAKSNFGGNLEVALRTSQVRYLIELYALSTGQNARGLPAKVRAVPLVESGGSLVPAGRVLERLRLACIQWFSPIRVDRIGASTRQNAPPIVIKLDGPATTALLRGEEF